MMQQRIFGFLTCMLVVTVFAACSSVSATATNAPQSQTFVTSDGVTLKGTLYGHGSTTIILSNMLDNAADDWSSLPATVAAHGYSVLTYTYRMHFNSPVDYVTDLNVGPTNFWYTTLLQMTPLPYA